MQHPCWHRARPTQRFGYLIGTASPTRPVRSGRAGRAPEPPGVHTARTPGAAGQQVNAKNTLKDHRWPVDLVIADTGGSSQQKHRHCHQPSHHRGETAMSSPLRPDRPARLPDQPRPPTEPASAPAPVGTMWAAVRGWWARARGYQRLAYVVGGALILVGLGHLAAWLVVGGAWAGPVSLRKPTTFGISFGLTTITLAWVTGHLRITDRTRWLLLGPLAAATSYEVAWVVVQHARGTPPISTTPPPWTSGCSSPVR
jgi:hypothetical protein